MSRVRGLTESTVNEDSFIRTYMSGYLADSLAVAPSSNLMVMVPKLLGVDTLECHVSTKNLSSFVSRRDAVVWLGDSQWSRRERDGEGEFVVGWKGRAT